jgi:hypothetical protein
MRNNDRNVLAEALDAQTTDEASRSSRQRSASPT